MRKKLIAMIMSVAMLFTLIPATAFAADSVDDYSDVFSSDWFYDSVSYVTVRGYMNGTSTTAPLTFEPQSNATRAMFATIMSRIAGIEVNNDVTTEFTDVVTGQWYTGAVKWGEENAIIEGYGNGKFGTDDAITRQDAATLMKRFVEWYCEEFDVEVEYSPKTDVITDEADVAAYAKEAVTFCYDVGLIEGYEDGSFGPAKNLTRAEIATIVSRLDFLINGLEVAYKDDKGKAATVSVEEGEIITVDPNRGKVTYDGTEYSEVFTITVGSESITLPDAKRSGQSFKGWKLDIAEDGSKTFTAQWRAAGGGGGSSPTRYTITLNVNDGNINPVTYSETLTSGSTFDLENDIDATMVAALQNKKAKGFVLLGWDEEDTTTSNPALGANAVITVDRTVTYYAIWMSEGSLTKEDYNISIKLGKQGKLNTASFRPEEKTENDTSPQEKVYHAYFDSDGKYVGGDDISLKTIAMDLCTDESAIESLRNGIVPASSGANSIIDSNGVIRDITVYKPVAEIVKPADVVAAITGSTVSEADVIGVLENIDGGIAIPKESSDRNILDKVVKTLHDQIESKELVNNVDENTLSMLGGADNLINMARTYFNNLIAVYGYEGNGYEQYPTGKAVKAATTVDGVAVQVNPVDALITMYEDKCEGDAAYLKEKLAKYVKNDKKVYNLINVKNGLIDKCNPKNFFTEVDDGYKMKSQADYSAQMKEIIELADEVRIESVTEGYITEQNIKNIIDASVSKAKANISDDSDALDKISANRDTIAALMVIVKDANNNPKNPTLIDYFTISGRTKHNGVVINTNQSIKVEPGDVDKILSKVSADIPVTTTNDLKLRLEGTYTAEIIIETKKCLNTEHE